MIYRLCTFFLVRNWPVLARACARLRLRRTRPRCARRVAALLWELAVLFDKEADKEEEEEEEEEDDDDEF
jgi:hypothetical protein